jgi:hypothetical protein
MMKKQLFSLLVMASMSLLAQNDIGITLHTPSVGYTIKSGEQFELNFEVINEGSGTILSGDTIFIGYAIADQIVNGSAHYILLTEGLTTGQSTGNLGGVTTLTFSGLEGEAQFCVVATYGPVNGSFAETDSYISNNTSCKTLSFTGGASVSVDELENNTGLLYPNPASDVIYVDVSNVSTVRVYDMNGREMKSFRFDSKSQKRLPIHEFDNGLYICRMYDAKNTLLKTASFSVVK